MILDNRQIFSVLVCQKTNKVEISIFFYQNHGLTLLIKSNVATLLINIL